MKYWPLSIGLLFYIASSCDQQVQFEEGFVLSGGDSIYYKVEGEGSPLLIIHGGPVLDHQYLEEHLSVLSKDHQLIYYDQSACGKSSIDIAPNQMTFDFMLKDIEAIRLHLGLDKLSVLGHSWGGLVAMKYAIAYEERLDRLILSNSMAPKATWWDQENRMIFKRFKPNDIDKRDRLASSGLMRTTQAAPYIEEYMLFSYKPLFYDTTKLERLSLHITDDYPLRSNVFMHLSQEIADYDLLAHLRDVDVPTLIIYGDQEPATSFYLNEFAKTLPNTQRLIVTESGHFPFIEQPDVYFQTIRHFLN